MKYIFAFLVFSPMASAASVDVCDTSGGAEHFISQWSEDRKIKGTDLFVK